MPSAKKKKQMNKKSHTNKEKPDIEPALDEIKLHYLLELLNEDKLFADLQRKRASKKPDDRLSSREEKTLAALDSKSEAAQDATRKLKRTNETLQTASAVRADVQAVCMQTDSDSLGRKLQKSLMKQSERGFHTALRNAKDQLVSLLEEPWVQRILLATAALGTFGWLGHRAYLSTASATSDLLREANKMAETIQATTELIQTTSNEGAKWTFSALGGAAGVANGLLLNALLSNSSLPGKATATASALTSAALGMYSGWQSMR